MGDAGKMGAIRVGSDGQVVKTGTEQPVNSFVVVFTSDLLAFAHL